MPGILIISVFVGAIAAAIVLVLGSSWWVALLVYSLAGALAMLGLAIALAGRGTDESSPEVKKVPSRRTELTLAVKTAKRRTKPHVEAID
ncbi:hypothetical protein [Tateyamaria sp. ANG-S1]|uniref:hypothetical protein n=1 Tax=Tateyamaria sp. ANG-S1 TaxID=1577905 RepID=UPI00057ED9BB|nr:hypothetical protein [Tateyamaria sp. ANG-S1]KIC49069.1 hypothetical protein RA29_15695 [Tateyamaria sp. ANG-S1]